MAIKPYNSAATMARIRNAKSRRELVEIYTEINTGSLNGGLAATFADMLELCAAISSRGRALDAGVIRLH